MFCICLMQIKLFLLIYSQGFFYAFSLHAFCDSPASLSSITQYQHYDVSNSLSSPLGYLQVYASCTWKFSFSPILTFLFVWCVEIDSDKFLLIIPTNKKNLWSEITFSLQRRKSDNATQNVKRTEDANVPLGHVSTLYPLKGNSSPQNQKKICQELLTF